MSGALLSEEMILAMTSTVLLILSELLPFVSKTEGNGVMHTIVLICTKIVLTSKQKIKENE